MKSKGYIKLHRQILDNPISTKANYLAVWVYLLLKANHEDREIILNGKKTLIKRGQLVTSVRGIAERFRLSKSGVHKIFIYLKGERMIGDLATRSYSLVTILNYDEFQKDGQASGHRVAFKRTQKELNKNEKNEKNINIIETDKKSGFEKYEEKYFNPNRKITTQHQDSAFRAFEELKIDYNDETIKPLIGAWIKMWKNKYAGCQKVFTYSFDDPYFLKQLPINKVKIFMKKVYEIN